MLHHPLRLLSILGLLALLAGCGGDEEPTVNPLAAGAADPFAGTFRGTALTVSLQSDGGAAYSGTFERDGSRWPATARREGDTLAGSFDTGSGSFPFSARRDGAALVVESGGSTYRLEAPAPAGNPLAGGVAGQGTGATAGSTAGGSAMAGGVTPAGGSSSAPTGASGGGAPLDGQEIVPGQRYASGTRLRSSACGVALTLPPRWDGLLPQGAEAMLLVSDTEAGIGIVYAVPQITVEEARTSFSGPQDLGDGVVLQPAGPIQVQGNVLTGRYRAAPYTGLMRCVVAPTGNGLGVLYAGPAEQAQHFEETLAEIFRTVVFAPPGGATGGTAGAMPVSGASGGSKGEEWRSFLAGMMLKYLESYSSSGGGISGGYNIERTLDLCRDGTYAYYDSSLVSAGGVGINGYGAGSGQHDGRWQVQSDSDAQALLLLTDTSGQVHRHQLGWDASSQRTYLDGERVFRVPSERCP
jgi:hypothetical protein